MSLMGLFLLIWPMAMSEKANQTEILNAILLGNRRVYQRRAAEISISDFFPASAISEIFRFSFADTRYLWCTGLDWSTATAAGATYTVLDCTRRSAVLMRARARHFPTVAEWGFCPP